MLLSANFGALKGYLIGAGAFWGFVFVLTVIWVFGLPGTPALTGPKGTDPSFKQFELNSSLATRYNAAHRLGGFFLPAVAGRALELLEGRTRRAGGRREA